MFDPEDVENTQDVGGNTVDNYISVEMPINRLMTEFFEGSNTDKLMQCIFAHIKMQA